MHLKVLEKTKTGDFWGLGILKKKFFPIQMHGDRFFVLCRFGFGRLGVNAPLLDSGEALHPCVPMLDLFLV